MPRVTRHQNFSAFGLSASSAFGLPASSAFGLPASSAFSELTCRPPTRKKKSARWPPARKKIKRSMSQTIDLVVTINSVQKSSKSELSSGTFGHFKVFSPAAQRWPKIRNLRPWPIWKFLKIRMHCMPSTSNFEFWILNFWIFDENFKNFWIYHSPTIQWSVTGAHGQPEAYFSGYIVIAIM